MEDPWASGSGWAETPKKESTTALPISTSPIQSPPPAASDPWGAPTPDTVVKSDALPTFGWNPSPVKDSSQESPTETPGWGGGWEEPSVAGPSRSPIRRPADSPEWSMSPRNEDDGVPRATIPQLELEHSPQMPLAIEAPPSPGGFAETSPPQSPAYAIPDLGGFEQPSLPLSPTPGDDFGGFESFGDDPWGSKKKEQGKVWGGSSDHESGGNLEDVDVYVDVDVDVEENSEEGDGWGGSRVMDRLETSAVTSSDMDQDWEEAQKRIKVTEQRAVSLKELGV
jgi:hypothetical protein